MNPRSITTSLLTLILSCGVLFSYSQAASGATSPAPAAKKEKEEVVREAPKFKGKDKSEFEKWVVKRVKYPKDAAKAGIGGVVSASFIIEKNGAMGDVKLLSAPSESIGEEVVSVMKSSPVWTPGKVNGEEVRAKQTLNVSFGVKRASTRIGAGMDSEEEAPQVETE